MVAKILIFRADIKADGAQFQPPYFASADIKAVKPSSLR